MSDQPLICLSSGQPASSKVASDLLSYLKNGDDEAEKFIKERLVDKEKQFHDPLKRQKLQTFECMAIKKVMKSSQMKAVEIKADRNLLGRLLLLCQTNDLDLTKLFTYQLGPVPRALSTADGHMTKSSKAQLMHALEKYATPCDKPTVDESICAVDGNALLQSLINLPDTFGQLAHHVFKCLPKCEIVHFVTDSYKVNSIKQLERDRRGQTGGYSVGGPLTKVPNDFKSFMLNSSNKQQLIRFILSEWRSNSYAADMFNRTVYFVCEETCFVINSVDEITTSSSEEPQLACDHEEANTRIVLHCLYAAIRLSEQDQKRNLLSDLRTQMYSLYSWPTAR